MGWSRAAGAFIAVLILSALSDLARGGDLVECEPQRVTGDGRHWAYRIVDGRECWYPGRPREAKDRAVGGSRGHPFRAPTGGPTSSRAGATRAALSPRSATGESGDHRGNAGEMAPNRPRPVARVHLLLARTGGARPAAGLAVGPATARALRALVGCHAKTGITRS